MSQFDLTPEEDAIVLSALRAKANNYLAMYSAVDTDLEELIAKVEGQLSPPVVEAAVAAPEPVEVVEEVAETPEAGPSETEETAEETPTRKKRAK